MLVTWAVVPSDSYYYTALRRMQVPAGR